MTYNSFFNNVFLIRLGVPKFSFRSELMIYFKNSIRRTELIERFFWANWTFRTVLFERTKRIELFFFFFFNELNWWNSSFERTELFKQFAQNELNCSKSSARSKRTFRSVLSLIWTELWTWAGAPLDPICHLQS
jgi:hypothetical protein